MFAPVFPWDAALKRKEGGKNTGRCKNARLHKSYLQDLRRCLGVKLVQFILCEIYSGSWSRDGTSWLDKMEFGKWSGLHFPASVLPGGAKECAASLAQDEARNHIEGRPVHAGRRSSSRS